MSDTTPYKRLIRGMIANDESCSSPFCDLSLMGHLLSGLDKNLVKLVKQQDETMPEFEGDLQ